MRATFALTTFTTELNDDLFAFMRYERDWWRLQIYHEAITNRLSINTYIYIFPHNLCKMQVFNLVFDSQIRA